MPAPNHSVVPIRRGGRQLNPAKGDSPCVVLMYFNAGGGHRAAASALQAQLIGQHPAWDVQMIDLFEILDSKHVFKRLTGFAPEDYYNKRLATGFTLGLAQELKVLQAAIKVLHRQLVTRLMKFWRQALPDMVVSLVPNFNRAIGASLAIEQPNTPFVTVMTDLADYPPNFWVVPGYTQHLVCGTSRARDQALAQGIHPKWIQQVSGMILSPKFYSQDQLDKPDVKNERLALGFEPDDTVGLVMYGGHGSNVMKRIAANLADKPLVLMCGRNDALRKQLLKHKYSAKHHVVGFTDDVARWMRLADYFIGKPGPGSISEALHGGLPVIVTRNAWTMPQERWNTDFIRDNGLGCVVASSSGIAAAVENLAADMDRYRSRVSQYKNRALFEVVGFIETLLQQQPVEQNVVCAVNR